MTDDVQRSLGRIEGALKVIQEGIAGIADRLQLHAEDDTAKFAALDTRMRGVERRQSYWAGAIALAVILFTSAITYFRTY